MNENTFVDSFFFLFSLHFCFLGHFKIIWCFAKSLIATSTHFLLKYNWKEKTWKVFVGVRVWAPKPVYESLKRPEYVTVLYIDQFLLLNTIYFFSYFSSYQLNLSVFWVFHLFSEFLILVIFRMLWMVFTIS